MRWGWGFLIMRICLEVCIFFLLGVLNWIYLWFLGYVILLMMLEVLLIGCWCMICLRFWSFGDSLLNFLCLLFIRRSIVRMRYSLLWIGCWIMICWKVWWNFGEFLLLFVECCDRVWFCFKNVCLMRLRILWRDCVGFILMYFLKNCVMFLYFIFWVFDCKL